jgi:hypothetical protein
MNKLHSRPRLNAGRSIFTATSNTYIIITPLGISCENCDLNARSANYDIIRPRWIILFVRRNSPASVSSLAKSRDNCDNRRAASIRPTKDRNSANKRLSHAKLHDQRCCVNYCARSVLLRACRIKKITSSVRDGRPCNLFEYPHSKAPFGSTSIEALNARTNPTASMAARVAATLSRSRGRAWLCLRQKKKICTSVLFFSKNNQAPAITIISKIIFSRGSNRNPRKQKRERERERDVSSQRSPFSNYKIFPSHKGCANDSERRNGQINHCKTQGTFSRRILRDLAVTLARSDRGTCVTRANMRR